MTGCCRGTDTSIEDAGVEIVLNIPDTFNIVHSKDDKNTGLLFTRVWFCSLLHQFLAEDGCWPAAAVGCRSGRVYDGGGAAAAAGCQEYVVRGACVFTSWLVS